MWEAVPYEPSLEEQWDALVRSTRQRHFMFERSYMEYHADRFDDASLIILRKGRPWATLPASRHGDEIRSHGGLTFGGLLTGTDGTTQNVVDALECALNVYRQQGANQLLLKPAPHIYHLQPAEEDLYAIAVHGGRLVQRDVSSALRPGDVAVRSEERRRAVKKGHAAVERGEVQLGTSDAWDEYMELQRQVLVSRHGVEPVHTAAEMCLLEQRFPGRIVLWTATSEGEIVAGVVIYETETVAHVQYTASGEKGQQLRAQDALVDKLITQVYANKRWFDFGISTEPGRGLNAGLARFKEGFGARAVLFDRYALALS